jgi:hypothetical protein
VTDCASSPQLLVRVVGSPTSQTVVAVSLDFVDLGVDCVDSVGSVGAVAFV